MTVVLITGNLINQFKCLITTARLKAEHKGSRCDVDEFQQEMGEQKANSQHFSMETRGMGAGPGKSWGPHKPEVGALERELLADAGMEQPSETSGTKASSGP